MRRIWQYLSDVRVLAALIVLMLAAYLYVGADTVQTAVWWLAVFVLLPLCGYLLACLIRWCTGKSAPAGLAELIAGARDKTDDAAPTAAAQAEIDGLRKNMQGAIAKIRASKIGLSRGTAALYAMPWYMLIGNPAAGKSSAIVHSGLQFPYSDNKIVQGIGGTRNCDWFFTTEGILLDTAGRYAVHGNDGAEWRGFLDLLKKYRKRAPINGVIVAVSIAELARNRPQATIDLARDLRTRVQELTERLAVFVPIYVMFTKADLVPGFKAFFDGFDTAERERVWGATRRYSLKDEQPDVLAFFDSRFDELLAGLKDIGVATMAQQRGATMTAGVFTFPAEFAALRQPLRTFLATLFEENAYQFKPVLRGFYFSSACQDEGKAADTTAAAVAARFHLDFSETPETGAKVQSGFFLTRLFREVIFADRDLVSQYVSRVRVRVRTALFFGAALAFGLCLGGWSWSYMGNRQLAANVQADLDKVIELQEGGSGLQARLESLDIVQDRLRQLATLKRETPWSLGLGLYQGDRLEQKLREQYYLGVREVLLKPVAANIEALLAEMNAHPEQLAAAARLAPATVAGSAAAAPAAVPKTSAALYEGAAPLNADDGYNALKTYLMLADRSKAEVGHLNDQLSRFWRGWLASNRGAMPREQLIRSAERLITFYLSQARDPAWPQIDAKFTLIDQSRETLRPLVRGMPARERVYGEIRARANTRFAPMTVARIVGEQGQDWMRGSYAVPGAYTRAAAEQFMPAAFRDAANQTLRSFDWVLDIKARDDLTLEGSPEQIQKALLGLYKADYIKQWKQFIEGIAIKDLADFNDAVQAMNRLGDPQLSPIGRLIEAVHRETAWDSPAGSLALSSADKGVFDWFKRRLGWLPDGAQAAETVVAANAANPMRADQQAGVVAAEFAGVARLLNAKDKDSALLRNYLDGLSKLRGRLNQLKNQGDAGPGAKQLMQQTLDGSGSELADVLKYVDEQMLVGIGDGQKQAIRPLLVRPLMQTFAVIVQPSEIEINKTWGAQVLLPFQKTLAAKLPFARGATSQASTAEIAQLFGPDGAIAKFVGVSLGPLVVRRGDTLSARTWAGLGVSLSPQVMSGFSAWVAPLPASGAGSAPAAPQTRFQLKPLPLNGAMEYTLAIDGQQLRYRNTAPDWIAMTHPGPQGAAGAQGARITALTIAGRTVELFNESGPHGLKRMIDAAVRTRKDGGVFELKWNSAGIVVAVELKLGGGAGADSAEAGLRGVQLPALIVGAPAPAATAPMTAATASPARGAAP